MPLRRPFAIAALSLLLGGLTLSAATREEEAKKAADTLVKSKDAKARLQAVQDLGKLGSASLKLVTPYIDQLTDAIKDKDAKVRGEASRTLAIIDPPEKKAAIEAIAAALKAEKDIGARGNMEMGLGDLGALAKEEDLKKICRTALQEANKTATEKDEKRKIQTALQTISGKTKKKE